MIASFNRLIDKTKPAFAQERTFEYARTLAPVLSLDWGGGPQLACSVPATGSSPTDRQPVDLLRDVSISVVGKSNWGEFNGLRCEECYRAEAGFIRVIFTNSGLSCVQIAKDEKRATAWSPF